MKHLWTAIGGSQALLEACDEIDRSLPSDAVIAGITSALSVGAISPDAVAVEARRHATTHTPAPASPTRGGCVGGGMAAGFDGDGVGACLLYTSDAADE